MAHQSQMEFVARIRDKLPQFFDSAVVLEVGSLDINGSVRQLFSHCQYVGIDLGPGPGVDTVCRGEEFDGPDNFCDTTISCECFEHNPQWAETFANMVRVTRKGGLVLFTCASEGRPEHGTPRSDPASAPFCGDYYRNLTEDDFLEHPVLGPLLEQMESALFERNGFDLYFWGIK